MNRRKSFARSLLFFFLLACLLTGLIGSVRAPVSAAPQQANALDVVINEIAWGGTEQSGFDEWIELYTPSDISIDLTGWRIEAEDGSPSITLDGALIGGATPDSKYLLLERATQNVVSDVAGFVYPGSSGLLDDTGEILYLLDDMSNIIDVVNSDGGGWPAGTISPTGSMERQRTEVSGDISVWATNDGSLISNGLDAATNDINGTPGQPNWVTTITFTTLTDNPDPSNINEDVTLSVFVDGAAPVPEGSVTITDGTNTLCTIILSNAAGNCVVSFSTLGVQNLIATYNSTSGHADSTDTEQHTVLYSTVTTITTDNPDPSVSNQNVSVSVRVTGGPTTPTGTVAITGADTNCSISLSASGTGTCTVRFTSAGARTLIATYNGDTTHSSSADTENHQVLVPTPTRTRTPTPVRTATRTPTPQPPPPPPPLLAINEFVPRPGHDWNNDGFINTDDEYIELINHGVVDVNLSGYRLDDEVNIGSPLYSLPSVVLKPGERYVLYGSDTGLLLSDGGDGVRLLRSNGQLVDAYNYFVVDFPDQSFCRLPDNGGLDDWNTNCYPTPGVKNSLSGSSLRPPTLEDEDQTLCPVADTLPEGFVLAECSPFGNNIWSRYYWDRLGWYGEMALPNVNSKWDVYAD